MLDSIKMINEEGTSTPYSLVGGACSVISTTNNGNGSYTLNLPDGTELENNKIYYVKFSPTTASTSFNVKLNNKSVYSKPYTGTKNLKGTSMYYIERQYCFGTVSPVLPLMYTANNVFHVVGEHIIAGYYSNISISGITTIIKYNVYTSGRAEYYHSNYSNDGTIIITASSSKSQDYSLTFKDPPHVEISCWGKDENNIPSMVLTKTPSTSSSSYKVLNKDVYGYSIKAEGIVF